MKRPSRNAVLNGILLVTAVIQVNRGAALVISTMLGDRRKSSEFPPFVRVFGDDIPAWSAIPGVASILFGLMGAVWIGRKPGDRKGIVRPVALSAGVALSLAVGMFLGEALGLYQAPYLRGLALVTFVNASVALVATLHESRPARPLHQVDRSRL